MTSMPASRKARAMILAPRSWPSRPGLAINTRIFFSGMFVGKCSSIPADASRNGYFFVGAEDFAEGVANFAYGGVGFYGVEEIGHEIVFAFGGFAEGV